MNTLMELKEQVEKLAEGHQEPEDMCWLHHDEHGSSETDYCPNCAEAMYNWLIGGEKPVSLDLESNNAGHPIAWHGQRGYIQILRDNGQEVDVPRYCDLCEQRLAVTLLEEGATYEVEHFEGLLAQFQLDKRPYAMSPDEWFAVLEMVEAIEHVEADWFPGQWMKPYEVENRRDTYGRVKATVEGLLHLAQPE